MKFKTANSTPINLNRVIEDAMANLSEQERDKVRRIIPIAFPVMEVEHTVKIRKDEPLGLIERYVLESIARFGPIKISEVAGLMGLKESDIKLILSDLKRFPSTMIREEDVLSAPKGTLERIADGKLISETKKTDAYFVNGLSGKLLPSKEIDETKASKRQWLKVDLSGDKPKVLDSSDKIREEFCWILPSGTDGRDDLERVVTSTDVAERASVGIPEGAVSVESPSGVPLTTRWMLSLGILHRDDSFSIRPVCSNSLLLLDVKKSHLNSVADLIRQVSSRGGKFLTRTPDSGDISHLWKSVAQCRVEDGKIILSLNEADSFNFFTETEDDEKSSDQVLNSQDRADYKEKPVFPKNLNIALERRCFWDKWTYFFGQLQPGDDPTAKVMLKIQGIILLSRRARSDQRNQEHLDAEWVSTQDQITNYWPITVTIRKVEFSEIKNLALRSNDTALVEFVSEMP